METGQKLRQHYMWCKHDGKKVFGVLNLPAGAEDAYYTGATFPTVVLSHGLGASHSHMDEYAATLAESGFVTYAFDFCGGGADSKSDGTTLEMSVETERDDLLAAVRLMRDEPFVNKDALFLMGNSQGGYVSALLASEMPELFRGMALLYPAFMLYDNMRKAYPQGAEDGAEGEAFGIKLGASYVRAALAHDPFAQMRRFEKDVLIVHGTADEVVPLAYSQRAASTYPKARLEVFDGAPHGFRGADRTRAALLARDFFRGVLEEGRTDTVRA